MLNVMFSLLQNVERPVSPHGEVHVFAAVPCGLPVCCEGEVAAVRGRDDQSPGGAIWRKHQTAPPTGPQARHAWHKNIWHQPKLESIIYTFMPDLPNKKKGRKIKEQLIWSMSSFSFAFSSDTTNVTLFYFVGLSPDFCVVASSAEDGSPDREANHVGENTGSHGDY